MDKKLKLIKVMEEERKGLPEYDAFGDSNDLIGYDKALHYLKTGEYDELDLDDHDLLNSVVNDIDMVYSDYCIK